MNPERMKAGCKNLS